MPKVLCLRPEADFTRLGVVPPKALEITYMAPEDPALADEIAAADALVIPAVGPKLSPRLFAGSRVRLVQVTGAGVDRLDLAAMREMGIAIANVPGGSNDAIAEYVLGSAIALLRRLTTATAAIRGGNYAAFRGRMISEGVSGLEGLVAGVIGMGVIGRAVALRLHQSGARLVCHDPVSVPSAVLAEVGATAMDLDDLLAVADVVTLHVPLLPSTVDLIDARRIRLMKPQALLIHAARGTIVNEAALAAALQADALAGAAVDVYSTEPPAPDNPLLALSGGAADRLILTPHVAGVSRQSWVYLFTSAWDNVIRVLMKGEAAANVILASAV